MPLAVAEDNTALPNPKTQNKATETASDIVTDEKISETLSEQKTQQEMAPKDDFLKTLDTNEEPPSLIKEGVRSLFFLLVLLAAFWWVSNWLKKTGKIKSLTGDSNIQCKSVYSVGPKEKIALIQVKDQEILVGITQHSIQPIHVFSPTLDNQDLDLHQTSKTESEEEFEKVIEDYQNQSKEHSS